MASTPTDPGAPAPSPPSGMENNPGTIEDLHKQCQSVFPMFFEGAKFMVNKGLSSHFQVSHTMTMSSTQPSGYRFGATYVGSKMLSPTEAFPLLMADVDPSGNLNANIVHAPSDRTRFKAISQIQDGRWVSTQMSADYKAPTWTTSLTLGNPDLVGGSGVGVLHYLRSVTSNVAIGAELVYQRASQIPGGHVAVASLASKLKFGDDATLACTLGSAGQLHATFWQKCSGQLQMGVEMETNLRMKEASATLGYEVDLDKANLLVRGSVDTNLVVKSVIEKKLAPLPFTLALCGLMNHKKAQFQFGCGLIIG